MTSTKKPDQKRAALRPDVCVIGSDPAGLSVAAMATAFGASVVLVGHDRETYRLPAGTLQAQALRAAADQAFGGRHAGRFGIGLGQEPDIAFEAVRAHVQDVLRSAAPMNALERYRAMGVRVLEGGAEFVDRAVLAAGGELVRARRFVLATGSRSSIPGIPGLEAIPYLTCDTPLDRTTLPSHLIVLGDGPVAVEAAQAYRRLGAQVTLIGASARILEDEDPEMAAVVDRTLRSEGVVIRTGMILDRIEKRGDAAFAAVVKNGESEETLEASHLLVAAGRSPNLEGFGLDKARIKADSTGIQVDRGLRTANARIYAIGTCVRGHAGSPVQETDHHAGLVVRNILFRLPVHLEAIPIPRIVRTAPELAAIGMAEEEARARYGHIRILRSPFSDNGRARAERDMAGHVKAVVTPNGRILGCTIVGPRAGDLIVPWGLAMTKGLKVGDLAGLVYPHLTLSEATKTAAVEFLKPSAQNPWLRRLAGLVGRLG
ncbi:dihydrolipoyl dehydrogenase family protein [Microvirga rosea]|uniref:dihydrolipoyl dehydrogenase family protein n=1 Tax=Microvirga rosea TaxID=2715425 RepID=UPI001D0B0F3F|nr:NAD(P)/FAD-dependent oxidoreductase [Microvirga rosea]MCB8821675.1 NAD(P)/FAD-dependent oxidoreductase [Microvirga rosea]